VEDNLAKFGSDSGQKRGWQHHVVRRVIVFTLLFGLWLLLSGNLVVEFIILGAAASALVVFLTSHLLEPSSTEEYEPLSGSFFWLGLTIVRFLFYLPWLVTQIVTANLQVAYQILHPKMPIAPRLLVFNTTLHSEPSQILLAHSITLTPGTITMDLERSKFVVHALFAVQNQILAKGGMQERVARVFGERPEPATSMRIITDINELHR
jgi:multicomponent Na+:H+ antiporter subunit E